MLGCCLSMQAQQPYRYRLDFTVGAQNFVDTVEIEFERNQVYVPVTVDGRRLRFKLDTGSSQGVIYDDTPVNGLTPLGSIRSEDATGRSHTVPTVEMPSMKIGRITISGYKATLHHRQVSRRGEDGIIGFDLLRRLAAKIDVRRHHMILTDRKDFLKKERGYALPYRLENHTPRIVISPVRGEKAVVVFDTGSRQLLTLSRPWATACLARNEEALEQVEGRCRGQMAIGNFGVEQESEVIFWGFQTVRWGKLELHDVHSITTQGNSHIGAALLSYGTLTVNPFQRRMVFQPYEEKENACLISNPQLRIAFVPLEGKAKVGLLWERSKAYWQGFRQGDVVEQIDGRAVSFDDFLRFRAVYEQMYRFTVRDRHGVLRTFKAEMPTLELNSRQEKERRAR
jgi:hypothetical protein